MAIYTILNQQIKRENLPEFTRYLFKNRIKDRRIKMEITQEEFESYVDIQMSGIVNMWDIKNVIALTGLDKKKVIYIMENYSELEDKYFDNPTSEIMK